MNILQEDKELREFQEMELSYKKACELHNEYTSQVIMRRLIFRENCPHIETTWSSYEDLLTEEIIDTQHCKRCGKLIKKDIK